MVHPIRMSLFSVADGTNRYFLDILEDLSVGRLSNILNLENDIWWEIAVCILLRGNSRREYDLIPREKSSYRNHFEKDKGIRPNISKDYKLYDQRIIDILQVSISLNYHNFFSNNKMSKDVIACHDFFYRPSACCTFIDLFLTPYALMSWNPY